MINRLDCVLSHYCCHHQQLVSYLIWLVKMCVCLLFSWHECKWKCKGSDMSESFEFINLHVNVHVKMKTRSLSTFVYKQKVSRDFTRCLVKMFPSNKRRKQYLYHEKWNTLNWNGHQKYQKLFKQKMYVCVVFFYADEQLFMNKKNYAGIFITSLK